jgi:hypothetical protein
MYEVTGTDGSFTTVRPDLRFLILFSSWPLLFGETVERLASQARQKLELSPVCGRNWCDPEIFLLLSILLEPSVLPVDLDTLCIRKDSKKLFLGTRSPIDYQ